MKKQAELVNSRHALRQMANAGARREEPAGRITGERRCGDLETDKGTEVVRGQASQREEIFGRREKRVPVSFCFLLLWPGGGRGAGEG